MALAIRDVLVWDGISDARSSSRQTIRVDAGRIVAIGDDPSLAADARVLEPGPDCVAIPGLMDAHVHVTLDPTVRDPAEQARRSSAEILAGSTERVGAMLRAGITTARDLGGGDHIEIGLRDRIARGQAEGPRLLCAGQPLTSKGGHCHFWGGEVENADEIAAMVETQRDFGADWIKVMATGGVITKGTSPADAQFSQEDLEVACREAARHGLSVAAHCHATEGIRRAVRAGARTIEHCSWVGEKGFGTAFDAQVAREIGARGTWVSPTVNAGWARFYTDKEGKESAFFTGMRKAFSELKQAGAGLVASTDAGIPNVFHHDLPKALPIFARFADLSPVEVLRTATSSAARAFELEDLTGRLVAGLAADILVVDGDPLEDLEALMRPRLVVAAGREISPA